MSDENNTRKSKLLFAGVVALVVGSLLSMTMWAIDAKNDALGQVSDRDYVIRQYNAKIIELDGLVYRYAPRMVTTEEHAKLLQDHFAAGERVIRLIKNPLTRYSAAGELLCAGAPSWFDLAEGEQRSAAGIDHYFDQVNRLYAEVAAQLPSSVSADDADTYRAEVCPSP